MGGKKNKDTCTFVHMLDINKRIHTNQCWWLPVGSEMGSWKQKWKDLTFATFEFCTMFVYYLFY